MSNKKTKFDEQKALFIKWKKENDEEAKNKLFESLEPLIEHQVAVFSNANVPTHALKLEAYRLAAKALKNYDPTLGVGVGTHVSNYLRKLYRFNSKYQNAGRIPEHKMMLVPKYKEFATTYHQEHGKAPTPKEIAKALKIRESEAKDLQKMVRDDIQLQEDAYFSQNKNYYHDSMTVEDFIEYMKMTLQGKERQLYEKILKGEPLDQIAKDLGMSYMQAFRMKQDIARKMREELAKIQ